jgi:hypothetical protein
MLFVADLDVAIVAEETRLAELGRLSEAARGRLVELRVARERARPRSNTSGLLADSFYWAKEGLARGSSRRPQRASRRGWRRLRRLLRGESRCEWRAWCAWPQHRTLRQG